ncbi:MAG: hypothetical protein JNL43_12210 [Flavobacteriales bacterium]|nr:hypothetical protein [Flavobacteriales bacterium]
MKPQLGRTLIFSLVLAFTIAIAQKGRAQHATGTTEAHAHHELALLLAHTHLSHGVDMDGDRQWTVLPCWGLNYNYWLSPHWAIGVHTDFITETFEVEENLHGGGEHPTVERTRPVAPALMASYRPHQHWSFLFGAGAEFAQEGDLFLMRGGAEYTIHLGGSWETAGSIAYDARLDAYDSFTVGIGIARMFR